MRQFVSVLILLFSFQTLAEPSGGAPIFRGRMGINMLNVTVGNLYPSTPLASAMTFEPTVLWNLPTFRSRIGVHYIGEFGSKYGFETISGAGFSGYFYPYGLSTAYELQPDGTLIQKSKPGPYTFATITPVNFNFNDASGPTPKAFSAYMIEMGVGGGYDYPLSTNMVLSGELQYRFASAQENNTSNTIAYSGIGLMLVFSTSYH
jgi:hypothetical protein